jgi:hypothetical protein
MIFFKLEKTKILTWEYVKKELREDFEELKNIIKKVDDFFLKGILFSNNAKQKEEMENILKKGLTLYQGIKNMLIRYETVELDSFDETFNREIEYARRKVEIVYGILTNMAMEIGRAMWDTMYKNEVLDKPLKELDGKVMNVIQKAGNDEQKRNAVIQQAEAEKQKIIDGAMIQRENFAQGYLNMLIQQSIEQLNKKLSEEAAKSVENQEKEESNGGKSDD